MICLEMIELLISPVLVKLVSLLLKNNLIELSVLASLPARLQLIEAPHGVQFFVHGV